MRSLKRVKHNVQDCPAPGCANCKKDHNTLICLEGRREQKLHKAPVKMKILETEMMKTIMKIGTSLIQIYNSILVMMVLDMMMEMTSKMIFKKKMNMEKIKIMLEMCQKMKRLIA